MLIIQGLKTQPLNLFVFLFLTIFLTSCKPTVQQNDLTNEIGDLESIIQEKNDTKDNMPALKVKETKSSPDKRLSVVWYFVDSSQKSYRLTVIDKELRKVIFSRELQLKASAPKENTKLVSIIKVLNQLVLIKEESKKHKKYFVLKPDTGKIWEIQCPEFREEEFEVSYFAEDGYGCKGLLKTTREFRSSETKTFPKSLRQKKQDDPAIEETQIIEKDNIKAELSPYKSSKMQTVRGKRSTLKYFLDGKLKYEKHFSGKCTGCQWINQDNWNEAFRIEQVIEDKILLTQILTEVDDNGKPIENSPIYGSILIVPSTNKMLHLHCKEKDDEIAYVTEITGSTYKCKYSTDTQTHFKTIKFPKR